MEVWRQSPAAHHGKISVSLNLSELKFRVRVNTSAIRKVFCGGESFSPGVPNFVWKILNLGLYR